MNLVSPPCVPRVRLLRTLAVAAIVLAAGCGDSGTGTDSNGTDAATTMDASAGTDAASTGDADNDGMPDAWERAHGLNPAVADHNGTTVSVSMTGVAGYTNLECYLNELAVLRVRNNA